MSEIRKYSDEFLVWDAEDIATRAFEMGERLSDIHEKEEFKAIMNRSIEIGVSGQIHEMMGRLHQKYEKVLYNPECL